MAKDDHRIRLSDDDLGEIVSALRSRLAMRHGARRDKLERLIGRLEDVAPGNPLWRLGGTAGYPLPDVDEPDPFAPASV